MSSHKPTLNSQAVPMTHHGSNTENLDPNVVVNQVRKLATELRTRRVNAAVRDSNPFRFSHYRGENDGIQVLQLDTDPDSGPYRIVLNDGPPIYEGDPELDDPPAAQLEEELGHAKALMKSWKNRARYTEEDAENYREERDRYQAELNTARTELIGARTAIWDLTDKFHNAEKELVKQRHRAEQSQHERDDVLKEYTRAQQQISELRAGRDRKTGETAEDCPGQAIRESLGRLTMKDQDGKTTQPDEPNQLPREVTLDELISGELAGLPIAVLRPNRAAPPRVVGGILDGVLSGSGKVLLHILGADNITGKTDRVQKLYRFYLLEGHGDD